MITSDQVCCLEEDQLAYLYFCLKTEWDSLNMGYEFQFHYIKWFRNDSIQHLLNKYSYNLKDENKQIILDILNSLEQNK